MHNSNCALISEFDPVFLEKRFFALFLCNSSKISNAVLSAPSLIDQWMRIRNWKKQAGLTDR
jgi:hypothetical protein